MRGARAPRRAPVRSAYSKSRATHASLLTPTSRHFGASTQTNLRAEKKKLENTLARLPLSGSKRIYPKVSATQLVFFLYISGSACSTVGVHSQAWSTSGIGRLGSKSGRG
jgi:hypothetical protein